MKRILLTLMVCWISAFTNTITVNAQDYIGMAVMFGEHMQGTLRTEILNDAARNSMKRAVSIKSSSPSVKLSWPANISEQSVNTHVFSVKELQAMHRSNASRMNQLLSGKNITVEGTVRLPSRAGQKFIDIVTEGSEYRIWTYFGNNSIPALKNGSRIRVKGNAAVERSSYLTLRAPVIISTNIPVNATTNTGSSSSSANHNKLIFTRSAAITKEINQYIADNTASALKDGNTKAELLQILNGGWLQQEFNSTAAKYGFAENNLSDILSVAMVLCWQITHDVPEIDLPQGYKKIQAAMRESLSAAGWVNVLSNEEKQKIAELTSTGSMLIALRYIHAKDQKNTARLKEASKDAWQFIKEITGMDLREYSLTNQGFVKK